MQTQKVRTAIVWGGALLLLGQLQAEDLPPRSYSIILGATEEEATLHFLCDNGEQYVTHSRSFGIRTPRFSLALPQNSLCRVGIAKYGSSVSISVSFRDHRGNRSPMIYLKSPHIDLGTIRGLSSDRPRASLTRDDAMLAAVDDPPSPQSEELHLGKTDRIYQLKKM